MKLGILGAGGIASTMAKTVAGMKDVEAYAVAARDLERAQVFAQKYEVKKVYGSYEEMLADDEVELVYIATPHSHHYLHAKMCLEAGKHVLCDAGPARSNRAGWWIRWCAVPRTAAAPSRCVSRSAVLKSVQNVPLPAWCFSFFPSHA